MAEKLVHVHMGDALVDGRDPMLVIDPVWWTGNIYEGPAVYEASLRKFSQQQRLVYAILWYDAEVCNGGHHQFYFNSTGVVWRDALTGFEQAGAADFAANLLESVLRLGGSPSLERGERIEQLRQMSGNFDDLDEQYYRLNGDL